MSDDDSAPRPLFGSVFDKPDKRAADAQVEQVTVMRQAAADSRAAAEASDRHAGRMVTATWALVASTVALVAATVVLIVVTATRHG